MFMFYVKNRRLIVQARYGDASQSVSLKSMSLETNEWVLLASRIFSGYYNPTRCVNIISSKLGDTDFSQSISADVFLGICIDEYFALKNPGKAVEDELFNASSVDATPTKADVTSIEEIHEECENIQDALEEVIEAYDIIKIENDLLCDQNKKLKGCLLYTSDAADE